MIDEQSKIPTWQQAIIDKCVHPTGVWEPIPESAYEGVIPARFEAIAARYPQRIAVVDHQRTLTYAQLNAAANRVAHGLLARLGPGSEPVAFLIEHGVEGLITTLGVLKAGKFFVALDTQWPLDYLRKTLSLMEARLLLSDAPSRDVAGRVADGLADVCTLDEIATDNCHNPGIAIDPDDYRYVVFTSGSTGTPKGVIDIHRNAVRIGAQFIANYHVCPQDRILMTQRLSFSGSQNILYGAHFSGASLYMYDIHKHGPDQLPSWIAQYGVTIITLSPPVFRLMVEAIETSGVSPGMLASVRLVRTGGDRCLPSDFMAYRRLLPDTAIFRTGFGSSESKLPILILLDKAHAAEVQDNPIGWPPSGVKVLIVDEAGNPVPPNPAGEIAAGEIVIHSRTMAQGYWKQPELTRQKFRPDPYRPGWFYFYTGDLGRIGADGCIYHLGRIDTQVKIRGHRVELAEIERALLELNNVQDAVVALRGELVAEQRLVAWLVWVDPAHALTVSEVRRALARQLPSYMIPAHYVAPDRLPLNANGKIDRRNLPDPNLHRARPALDVAFVAPQSPLESALARIWSDILRLEHIGVHDNFFDLGGESIQAMQIFARIQDLSAAPIHIQAIFNAPTIAQLAHYLTAHYIETEQIKAGQIEEEQAANAHPIPPSTSVQAKKPTPRHQAGVDSNLLSRLHTLSELQMEVGTRPSTPETKNPPALFILAPPRSGTTLLRVLLAGHPQLFAPPELYLLNYSDLAQRRQANDERRAFRLEGTVRAWMALHNCSVETALEKMVTHESQNLSTQAFYALLQAAAGDRLLVDKTPVYASHIDILCRAERWFDAPRYIHLSRHPYAMIHSYVSNRFHLRIDPTGEFAPQQLAELIWLTYHQNIVDFLDQVAGDEQSPRTLHLRYEDLVAEPEATMRRICDWLDIAFEQTMLDPYADPRGRMTDGLYPESLMIGDPGFHRYTQVRTDRTERWRQTWSGDFLSPATIDLARQLGYDV